MLQDSEGFKYYNKNGLYVCVDYKKSKLSRPTNHNHGCTKHASMDVVKAMLSNAAVYPDIPTRTILTSFTAKVIKVIKLSFL